MVDAGVGRIVYSSSASVYGTPDDERVVESTPIGPESPYGETKLIGEWLVADAQRGPRPAAHVVALLQRRRLRLRRRLRRQPPQPVPARVPRPRRRRGARGVRHRLPDARRLVRPRLHPRRRPRRRPRARRRPPRRGRRPARPPTTSAPATGVSVLEVIDAVGRVARHRPRAGARPPPPRRPGPHRRRRHPGRRRPRLDGHATTSTTWSATAWSAWQSRRPGA